MLLENKNAVIYGAAGGIGSGVARTFAREGARLFLVGRTRQKLEALAADIRSSGGEAEVAVLDVLNEQAVEEHLGRLGRIDISFNLVTRGDVQGIPLIEMTAADLTRAVMTGLTANFNTARAAARRMVAQKSGVILMITSASSEVTPPMMGSTALADAATEAFMHTLAAEVGPQGVRVVGLWTAGVRETLTPEKIAGVNSSMVMDGAALEQMLQGLANSTMLRRAPALAQVADTAAFLASDRASGITGTIVNVTCGMVSR